MKNKHIKKSLIGFLLTIPFLSYLNAQFDAQSSLYMFNPASYNAAAIGESNNLSVIGQHRLHWLGMPNGGSTTNFNINMPFKIAGKKQGVGINFMNDKVGQFINQVVHLQYAYKFGIGEMLFSLAPELGFVSVGFHGDSIRGPQVSMGDYHEVGSDEVLPQIFSEGVGFDMGLGAWMTYKDFYTGFSYSHLNQPLIEWSDLHNYRVKGTYYFIAGYGYTLNNTKYVLKPSTLLKTDFVGLQVSITTLMEYNNQYWGGLSYRLGDAVVVMGGLNVGGGFRLAYAFDIPASQMIKASWGSHELVLSYDINIGGSSSEKRQSYKNVRIL